ncbi:hypothetical protein ACFE04_019586 [Oxalis oulophora]
MNQPRGEEWNSASLKRLSVSIMCSTQSYPCSSLKDGSGNLPQPRGKEDQSMGTERRSKAERRQSKWHKLIHGVMPTTSTIVNSFLFVGWPKRKVIRRRKNYALYSRS